MGDVTQIGSRSPEHEVVGVKASDADAMASRRRLVSIDVLRGAAALAVVLYHVAGRTAADGYANATALVTLPFKFGEQGVTLFLVISGFCIHLAAASRLARGEPMRFGWISFWRRRFHRLYPPFLVAIVYGLALYGLASRLGTPSHLIHSLPWDVVTHLLLAHNLFKDYAYGVGNPPFWSLGLEEQLYALYAVYLILRRGLSARRTLSIVFALNMAWVFLSAGRDHVIIGPSFLALGSFDLWPFAYWLYWVLGAVAAEAYTGAISLPAWCYRPRVAVVLSFVGVLLSERTLGAIAYGRFVASLDGSGLLGVLLKTATLLSVPAFAVSFFVVVNTIVRADVADRLESRLARWLARVGLISYSLYMVHYPLIQLLDLLLGLPNSPGGMVLRMLLFVPASLGVALAFFVLVERRFLNTPLPPTTLGAPRSLARVEG